MRAYRLEAIGTPPRLMQIEAPYPAEGEVLVRIAACGLNFADTLMIKGAYQEAPPLPATLGMELAGTVEALGMGVTSPAIGTRVAVFAGHGGLAEYGCFPAARCLPLSEAMSFVDAAALQVAYGTSHLALTRRARLQPGETLVVTGAAGGVGLTAVEIGALMRARVIAVARGADKLAAAAAAGAAVCLDSDSADLRAEVKALGGADVLYDAVGGDAFTALFRAMRPEGRILAIGFASGTVPQIPANHLLVKNVSVMGFYWGAYLGFAPAALKDSLAEVMRWHAEGRIKPHVSHVLPLAQAEAALALLSGRKSTGKVVVTME
ncbi:zinc-binding dehydrogenase [Frigidibacter albus]|uniref:Zinc-binding dehydrogenase n=1 Tax=Frigidibacter albus TaxID=1465486 RepID=A0A6L8VG08_9RHOB|nr:NADPH:quinone oxidoreductase family protein [Frigidibacter albus]MZQ88512.1 zinc-binding dehydrogenase [Frigidibacter albus]NBE30679.1 zinc-binding dehydrogenase [Frigidibacter albus]GGH48784.1 NADPH:quinone oxidoreductase [Frigidibacter albus]